MCKYLLTTFTTFFTLQSSTFLLYICFYPLENLLKRLVDRLCLETATWKQKLAESLEKIPVKKLIF